MMERKRAEEALKRTEKATLRLAQETGVIAEIGRIISSSLDIEEVYERFAEEVRKLIPFDRILVNLVNPQEGTITTAYAAGMEVGGRRKGVVYPLAGSITEEMIRTGAPVLFHLESIKDVHKRFPGLVLAFQAGLRSRLSVLLIARGEVIGSLALWSKQRKAYGKEDIRLAQAVAGQIAEEALRESEESYRSLVETSPDAIFLHDGELLVYLNPAALRLFDAVSAEELYGKKALDLVHPDYREAIRNRTGSIMTTGMSVPRTEIKMVRRDGSSVDVEATAGLSYYRGKKVVQVIQRDITERKRAESRVQREMEYKDFLLLFHEKAPQLSDKELYDYVLEETVRLTDSAIGFFHRVSDDQKTVVLTAWNSEALKNCTASYETHYLLEQAGNWVDCARFKRPVIYNDFSHAPNRRGLPDGHAPVRRFMSIPVMEGDKVRVIFGVGNKAEAYDESDALQIQLVANTLHAIMKGRRAETALREAHDELELRVQERTAELSQAYERLESEMAERTRMEEQLRQSQKMEAVGTLAGGIAHDFNNILAAIIGFTEMVLDDVSDNPDVQQSMEQVLKAGFRGRNLVKQIVTFSRRSDEEKNVLQLSPLVRETFKLLRASIPTTVEMKLDLDANRDFTYADPSQIQQIIMNLCTNASHAMREKGGKLEVSLRATSSDTGEPLPEPDMAPGEYLVLSVRDTGLGMDDTVMKRIFEPFFTTKEKGQGTGLGLAVVYGIVKSHKGGIHVSSRPGQGAVFSVYLPAARTEAEVKSETVSWETLPTGTERILLVDDEEPIVQLGQGVLRRLGYVVVAKRSGREALETFRRDGVFDLVITDQTMPEMTGVMLAAKLLTLRPDLPVILCTGHSESVSRETAQELGIREFLMKPLSKRELAGAVRRALEGNK